MSFIHRPFVKQLPHWMSSFQDLSETSELLDMHSLEPKSLFANERTFLHYVLKAVYLLLLDLTPWAILVVAAYSTWSLYEFWARGRKILSKRAVKGGALRLDVSYGPLVMLIVVGLSILSVLRGSI